MTEMVIQQLLVDAGAADVDPGPGRWSTLTAWKWRPTGGRCSRRRRMSATARAPASPRRDVAASTSLASTRCRAAAPQRVGARRELDGRRARRCPATSLADGSRFRFHARDLNLVMGPASRGASIPFRVFPRRSAAAATRTGSMWTRTAAGSVGDQRTYQLIRQPDAIADRLFEIEFLDAGVEAYCFTFG